MAKQVRAVKLDNSDGNIKKNLTFARSKRIDKVNVKTEKRVLQMLFFRHYDLSIKTKSVLTCIFFGIFCSILITMIWISQLRSMRGVAIISVILTVCFLGSVIFESQASSGQVCGVITAESVAARQGDGQNYPASFKEPLHSGTEFDLLESRPGWFHIILSDDNESWIPDTAAELI